MNVDHAFEAAMALVDSVKDRLEDIETEQDARLQLVNRFLTEVLGWDFAEIKTEPHSESGYTDYLLRVRSMPALVIEAKRTGKVLLDTVNSKASVYTVGGPSLKSASEGIRQAVSYCVDHGVDFATVTTGETWIGFQPFPGGGKSYRKGKAIVFPGLDAIKEDFARFFDLFSRQGTANKHYKILFAKAEGLSVSALEPLSCANRTTDVRLLPKTSLALDLDPVFKGFFGSMSGETDKNMLLECFVETRESRSADAALEKLVGAIAGNVDVLSTATGEQLVERIETAVDTGLGENVLIVGNKGAGKSTFIDRFFEIILDSSVKSKCLVIKIDLLESTGDVASIVPWLTDKLKSAIENALFIDGVATYDELQGLYYKEYQKWRSGHYKHLYDTDKISFKIKFGDFLHEKINNDPLVYTFRMLEDAVKNRHLLPCLIFDNTDHYLEEFQEAVFQWSQALRREIPFSLVILPITDRTIWRLSKAGPFQTYQSKMYYLPVPSTKEVLEKRIAYLREKTKEKDTKRYLLSKGIKLNVESISAFASTLEEVFITEDFISRRIGWLANHDIRRSLKLSQDVMTSPFLSVDDLIAAYLKRGNEIPLKISYRKFMQSLVLGQYNQFQQKESSFVLNLFTISTEFPSTPLLKASVLKLLIDKAGEVGEDAGYMPVDQLRLFFEAMGIVPDALATVLTELMDYRLVEPFDAAAIEVGPDQRLAITHSGRMHYEMLQNDPIYLTQMAFATLVRSVSVIDRLRAIKRSKMTTEEWAEVRRIFVLYCLSEDRKFARVPREEIFEGQRRLRLDLLGRWVGKESARPKDAMEAFPSAAASSSSAHSHVTATVKWFDPVKGYGFLDGGLKADVFLHARTLNRASIEQVAEGDVVVVDVAEGNDGRLQAIQVHSFESQVPSEIDDSEIRTGEVNFYNADKGFGFLSVEGYSEDIYVSAQVIHRSGVNTLQAGEQVEVAVGDHIPGRGRAATLVRLR